MKVLIAEDAGAARLVVQRAVQSLGHDCVASADGTEAWKAYQEGGFDVVISDLDMPGLDGLELCRLIRSQGEGPYAYFVFLTALEDKQHAVAGMRAGADDYLVKPLDVDDLYLRLLAAERVTGLHRQLAEARLLEGVLLAARTMENELGNKLASTVGWAELLAEDPLLPAKLVPAATEALRGAQESIALVRQLHQITHIQMDSGIAGPAMIDIPGSTA